MQKEASDMELQSLSPEFRGFFIFGEQVTFMESQTLEYKLYQFPLDNERRQILMESICSFLNTKGGFIFIGINDEHNVVQGVELTLKQKDMMKMDIINLVLSSFYPKVEMSEDPMVLIDFIPVKSKYQRKIQPGWWVIRVSIRRGDHFYINFDQG